MSGYNFRKQSRLSPRKKALIRGFMAPIHERVGSFVVSMKVTEDLDASIRLFVRRDHLLLQEENLWVNQRVGLGPPPI